MMANYAVEATFDCIVKAFPSLKTIIDGLKLYMSGLNWLFNTDKASENNLKLLILYITNSYAVATLQSYRNDDLECRNEESASELNNAYICFLNYQKYASTHTKGFVTSALFDGFVNKIKNIFSNSNELTHAEFQRYLDTDIKFCKNNTSILNLFHQIYMIVWGEEVGIITDSQSDGSGFTEIEITDISFSLDRYTLFSNTIITNQAVAYPTNASYQDLFYYSGNTSIATVDQSGKITAVGPGTVTIYAQSDNGVTGSCTVTVLPFYASISNNQYTITGCVEGYESLTIPSYVNGKPVVGIADKAFLSYKGLKSINIGNNVKSIGEFAFQDCTSLTLVSIPDSVTDIGQYAFSMCTSLKTISLPQNLTVVREALFWQSTALQNICLGENIKTIGQSAFQECSALTSITIPDSVTSIGEMAFFTCTNLCNVNFGKNINSIGNFAFQDCTNLISINIPDSVTDIGQYAFSKCGSLKSLTLPKNLKVIKEGLFWESVALQNVYLSNNVETIEQYAFADCCALTSIVIPDSVTSIGKGTFEGCTNLSSITLPFVGGSASENIFLGYIFGASSYSENNSYIPSSLSNVVLSNKCVEIGNRAFYDCKSLTSITIPDSVTSMGDYVFYNCKSLTEIVIPDSISSISSYAFYNCESLTSITIPDSITTIGEYAFFGCTGFNKVNISNLETWCNINFSDCYSNPLYYAENLYINGVLETNITIPDSVTSIGSYTFFNCKSLKSITIHDRVTSIGDSVFYDCRSLTSITIPDSVTSIGGGAFGFCTSLTDITIPDSVTSIGGGAFAYCTSLTGITIPNSITSIGNTVFDNCSSLTSITIPDRVTSISSNAFSGCTSLTSITVNANNNTYASLNGVLFNKNKTTLVCYPEGKSDTSYTIPDSVTSIDRYAFKGCSSLKSIIIPDSITSIGASAFFRCSRLINITIPDSVTSISFNAFYGCRSLTNITIPGSVTSIDRYAFKGCSSLKSIIIPDSVTSIDSNAFQNCINLIAYCNVGNVSELLKSVDCTYKCFGDLDDDKKLSSVDTVKMRKSFLGIADEEFDFKVADMNQDSDLDIRDLVRLKKKIAEMVA